MRRQIFFVVVLVFIVSSFVFFLYRGKQEIVSYFTLSQQKEFLLTRCEIVEKKSQFFLLGWCRANSSESSGENSKENSLILQGPFHNKYVAEIESRNYHPPQPITLWVNPHNSQEMTLTKTFPKKKLLYLVLFASIGLYFIFLKKQVERS